MHVLAVLNRGGGTLRDLDVQALAERIERIFTSAGHTVGISLAEGDDLVARMREAADDKRADVLLAGGGDGTISLAAGLLAHTDKALAVLPAGTMNLFARSLEIPLDLDQALEALASGEIRRVDIARANDRFFVHQFSVGMHPQLIRLRERMSFRSRIGKMLASVRAAVVTLGRPAALKVALEMGDRRILATTSSLAVTNNLYAEGQRLPFAAHPDGGRLGVYITRARRRRDLFRHFLNMGIGRWRQNQQVEIHETGEVVLTVPRQPRRFRCAIDGELCPLEQTTRIVMHPGALAVLVPVRP
ncbi:diacylglycerol/lipid kinase family protein [Nitratireductor pacificus]|uniref:Diacylglycerol kinase catalytic subunit n=1 Tax=Nitratireductor pacificus pht-3B TaxID=391937 RepID=K2M9K4_9HYPH|nr:diacylglycerol kinase family protein [Nitratireductor pacificus]EKF18816.1 diacylglycerol kinase catalytic subunit [Nitratireductor pacificus pht-3B]